MRLLLVEDTETDALDIKRKLSFIPGLDIVLSHVTSLDAAKRKWASESFDATLLDLQLPDSSGLESVEALLAISKQAPVIVLTALDDEELALQALARGAQDYLFKEQVDRGSLRRALLYAVQRKECETRLHQSETRNRHLFETMSSGVVYQDAAGKITSANPAAARILGCDLETLQNRTSEDECWQAIHPDGRPFKPEEHASMRALREGKDVRNVIMGVYNPREERRRWITIDAIPEFHAGEEKPWQVYTVFDDITEQKEANDKLRANEAFLREIQKVSRVGGFERDLVSGKGQWTNPMFAILGYEPGEVEPTHDIFMEHVHEADRAGIQRAMQESKAQCRDFNLEFRIRRKDGAIRHVHATYEWECDDQGCPRQYIGAMRDITREKQTRAALVESEERYRRIVQTSLEGIWWIDGEGGTVFVNDRVQEMLGFSHDVLMQRDLFDFIDTTSRLDRYDFFRRLKMGLRITEDLTFRQQSGRALRAIAAFNPVIDRHGEVTGALCMLTDITARKQAEDKLKDREYRLRSMIESTNVGFGEVDAQGRIRQVNFAAASLLDYTPEELVGTRYLDHVHPDDRDKARVRVAGLFRGEPGYRIEQRYLTKHGQVKWLDMHVTPLKGPDGSILSVLGAYVDVTERKKALAALQQSEAKLRAMLDTTAVSMSIADREGRLTMVNQALEEMLGYDSDELLGIPFSTLTHPDDLGKNMELFRAMLHGEIDTFRMEKRYVTKNGTYVWADLSVNPIIGPNGKVTGVVAASIDISERKRAELHLKESQSLLAEAERLAHVGAWKWDIEKDQWMLSDNWKRLHGLYKDHLSSSELLQIAHPEDRDRITKAFNDARKTSKAYDIEHRIIRQDTGEVRWIKSYGEVLFEGTDIPVRLIGAAQDITEQKRAETALKESEEKLRILVENIQEILWIRSVPDGEMLYLSPAFELIYGVTRDGVDLSPTGLLAFVHPEDRHIVRQSHKDQLQSGKPVDVRYRIIRPDGEIRWIWARTFPVHDADESVTMMVGIADDVTRLTQAEERLRQSEEQFRNLFEEAGESMFVHDLEGRFLLVNAQALKSLGYAREEICTLGVEDVDPGAIYKQDRQKLWQNLSGKERIVFEAEHKRKDGTIFPVEISLRPLKYQGQRVILATAHDLEERKIAENALKQSEEKYRALFDNAQAGIFQIRIEDGIILTCNQRYAEIYGAKDSEAMVGKSIVEFYENPEDRKYILRELRSVAPKPVSYISKMKKVDGEPIYVSASATLLKNGAVVEGVITDVTERMEARLELEERTQELNEANTALKVLLKQASQAREELESKIMANVEGLLMPHVNALEQAVSSDIERGHLEAVKADLANLTSGFAKELQRNGTQLTPRELQVADLIRQGKTSKEIAALLHLSIKAISFHRSNIRKKLGLKNRKVNLRAHLQEIS